MIKQLLLPDIEVAIFDFIAQCILPPLAPENIVRGWQNYSSLPKKTNEYAIYTVLFDTRSGTNVTHYSPDKVSPHEGVYFEQRQSICDVQLDFCARDENAMKRALCTSTIARSSAGVEFFKQYGVGCLYSDDPKAVEYVDGEDLYIRRWIVTLRLSFWTTVGIEMPNFDDIKISKIKLIK